MCLEEVIEVGCQWIHSSYRSLDFARISGEVYISSNDKVGKVEEPSISHLIPKKSAHEARCVDVEEGDRSVVPETFTSKKDTTTAKMRDEVK